MNNLLDKASPLIRLSQGHLNLLECCPPKFQQIYLDCLNPLPPTERQESAEWGSRFHLLMQQRELALPIESLLQADVELDRSLTALNQAAPDIVVKDAHTWREAEHCRTLGVGNFLLTVIYDLLIAQTSKATILDWKTYRQPQDKKKLANNWQTRLYLYVLAETTDYAPEQISMTYWFVKPAKPQSVTFNYSKLKHQKTQQDLAALLNDLEQWLEAYRQKQIAFPHSPNCQTKCPYYQYLGIVAENVDYNLNVAKNYDGQSPRAEATHRSQEDLLTSIADIEEISI
jgi:PD-(D/E)XK nuclease superfamily